MNLPEARLKIAFVHNAFIEYRTPLFEKISTQYAVDFFFEWFDHSFIEDKSKIQHYRFPRSFPPKTERSFSPTLFFYLLEGKYDLFIASGIGPLSTYITYLVSRLLHKPFVFWDETWCWPRTKWRALAWPMILWTIKNASAIVVPGVKSKEFYLSIDPSKKSKLFTAPNASLLPRDKNIVLQANRIKEELKLYDKKVILYCGRLMKQKGFEYILEAFAKLLKSNANAVLIVVGGQWGVGEKYDLKKLMIHSRVLGADEVHFTGWIDTPKKAAFFLLADVVVVPSIFDAAGSEVWGFAANEAMSMGKPVVATKAVGAAYDLIQDGINGYVVRDKDPDALLKAIKSIIDDTADQRRMGIQSFRILQEGFTYEKMFLGFVEAIKYVLKTTQKKTHEFAC